MAKDDARRPLVVSAAEARRIAGAVQGWEGSTSPRRPGGQPVNWNPGVARAKVTTAIPTGSDANPSTTGRAEIRRKDHAGAWVAEADAVTVHNDHTLSASIAVAKVVKLAWIDGDWYLIAADC